MAKRKVKEPTLFKKNEDHFLKPYRGFIIEQELNFDELIGEEVQDEEGNSYGVVEEIVYEENRSGRLYPIAVTATGRIDLSWVTVVDK